MQRTTIAFSFLALAMCAAAGAKAADATDLGHVGAAGSAERIIDVTPATRYLNVTNGETVTIRQGERSVTWHVLAPNNLNAVPLSRIAPQATQDPAGRDVLIYIAPGQQYQNS
jgi:hypothetical protein